MATYIEKKTQFLILVRKVLSFIWVIIQMGGRANEHGTCYSDSISQIYLGM